MPLPTKRQKLTRKELLNEVISSGYIGTIKSKELVLMQLVTRYNDKTLITNSECIAETFGKKHSEVLRDLSDLSFECTDEFTKYNYMLVTEGNTKKFLITENGYYTLVAKYNGLQADKAKQTFISHFKEMNGVLSPIDKIEQDQEEDNEIAVIHKQTILEKSFKIYGDLDNPLFLAKDVSEWIEHNQVARMIEMVDDDEKLKCLISTSGQKREMWFLTEEGLYEVLMQSRKPIAKQFKKQVKEILKSIRKHGGYLTEQKIEEALLNPDVLIQLATNLKEEQEKRKRAELMVVQKEAIIEEQKPKVEYADKILLSKSTMTITQIAKDYGITGHALNNILKEEKVQYKQGKQWLLYKEYQDKGYTKSQTTLIPTTEGEYLSSVHTKWTQQGRLFIHSLLTNRGIQAVVDQETV
jgi:anti-repressor protein